MPEDISLPDSILTVFKEDNYVFGDCSVVLYDRKRRAVFGDHYLRYLYDLCLQSRPKHPYGILPVTFCGMSDLSADTVCTYLANHPLLILKVGQKEAGFAFVNTFHGAPLNSPDGGDRAAFCGYCYFRPFWGTPESVVLGMLGISYLFLTYNLIALHGQRYRDNFLTARFMAQFGAVDTGHVPYYMFANGLGSPLVPVVVNTLTRAVFEDYVRRELVKLARP